METRFGSYDIVPHPPGHRLASDFLEWNRAGRHGALSALADAGALQKAIESHQEAAVPWRLDALLIKALALAVRAEPLARTLCYRMPPRLVRFDDCHVTVPVRRIHRGQPVVFLVTIKDCDRRSVRDLSFELDHLHNAPEEEVQDFDRWLGFSRLPPLLRRLIYIPMELVPGLRASGMGIFGLTCLAEDGPDEFRPVGAATVSFGVGGLKERPVARQGRIEVRPTLPLCMLFDQRVMGPYPAAAFFRDCLRRLEAADTGGDTE